MTVLPSDARPEDSLASVSGPPQVATANWTQLPGDLSPHADKTGITSLSADWGDAAALDIELGEAIILNPCLSVIRSLRCPLAVVSVRPSEHSCRSRGNVRMTMS